MKYLATAATNSQGPRPSKEARLKLVITTLASLASLASLTHPRYLAALVS